MTQIPDEDVAKEWGMEFTQELANFEDFRRSFHTGKVVSSTGTESDETPRTGTGKKLPTSTYRTPKPYVSKEMRHVIEPIDPIKIKDKDDLSKILFKGQERLTRKFDRPANTSAAMQKNLKILDLRLDTQGYLYSPKTYDPDWKWQSQAIWLRIIGMGHHSIAKRLNKKHETVKSMFGRLGIARYFRASKRTDWATIGFGARAGETQSGWTAILHGGSTGMLYASNEMIIDERSGHLRPFHVARHVIGEKLKAGEGLLTSRETEGIARTRSQEGIKPYNVLKAAKEAEIREKHTVERKREVILEQKNREVESLMRNIAAGFDPETRTYHE